MSLVGPRTKDRGMPAKPWLEPRSGAGFPHFTPPG
jgi:hypothetical protein